METQPSRLGDDGQPVPPVKGGDLNSQYKVMTSGANSKTKIKKAIKVKAKAKAKAKPKVSKMMKKPTAVTQAFVADSTGIDLDDVKWFLRVDYGATQYVGANEDPRCPD